MLDRFSLELVQFSKSRKSRCFYCMQIIRWNQFFVVEDGKFVTKLGEIKQSFFVLLFETVC